MIDSQFMALPVFTILGQMDSKPSYFSRMYELFRHTKTTLGLYDTTARLYYRDDDYIFPLKQTPNGKKVFWSRGNGWAYAALVRIFKHLPLNDPHLQEYVTTFIDLSASLKNAQRANGFWNVSLADPNHYPGPETSGTALFVYGMAWGMNRGLLSRVTYEPVVAKAWNAMVATALHSTGMLGYVQGVGKEPASSQPVTGDSTADFGVGAFLLAGSEVYQLAGGTLPPPCAP